MKKAMVLIWVLWSAAACSQQPPATAFKNIDNQAFTELMKKENMVVLDVRTPEEFQAGHIPKAHMLNYNDPSFKEQAAQLDKDKTYLVYCAKGGRSSGASQIMADLGFKHIYNLEKGFSQWDGEVEK